MYKQNRTINKDIENLKKKIEKKIMELKMTVTEILKKYSLEGFKGKLQRQKKMVNLNK